jgi:hypothetical protein
LAATLSVIPTELLACSDYTLHDGVKFRSLCTRALQSSCSLALNESLKSHRCELANVLKRMVYFIRIRSIAS